VVEAGPVAQLFGNPHTDEARRFIAGQLLV
jgi:hypothetical protein